jgi:hypothetical protein
MRKILISSILLTIFTLFIFSISSSFFDIAIQDNYMTNIILKKDLFDVDKKRLILVGGSSFGFSINSAILEGESDYDVINYGLHAGLGIEYMLDDISKYTRDGDIVVLGFEYELYYGEKNKSIILLSNNIEDNYSNILIDKYVFRLNSSLKNLYAYLNNNDSNTTDKIYVSNAINQNGDIISHLNMRNEIVDMNKKINTDGDFIFDEINDFIKKHEEKGVKVLITFPPIPLSFYNFNFGAIEDTVILIYKNFTRNIISSHLDFIFEDQLFFDSIYHMNFLGRDLRTYKLNQDLEIALK